MIAFLEKNSKKSFSASDLVDLILCQPEIKNIGGTERVMLEIAKKYNPVIFTLNYDKQHTFPEFAQFDIRVLKGDRISTLLSMTAKLDSDSRSEKVARACHVFSTMKIKNDYDVINSHLMPSEWISFRNERVCWYTNCPCRPVYDWRNYYMNERNNFLKIPFLAALEAFRIGEEAAVSRIKTICTNSNFAKRSVEKNFSRKDSIIIYPGVNTEKFMLHEYENFFFYPSRIVPEKNMEFTINAFKQFSNKFQGKERWKLILAGSLDLSKRNKDYYNKLAEMSKGQNIQIMTDLSEEKLLDLYSNCYATLFAGIMEDWGIVPVESMASEKPCIAMDDGGGPSESILDGKTGFLVKTPEEMAERMLFLAEHPDTNEKMGKAGRKRVLQNYTWRIFLSKIDKAFKQTARM